MIDIKDKIIRCSSKKLPLKDRFFNAVVSINVFHNLNLNGCKNFIRDLQRVSAGKALIQVDAFRNHRELSIFKDWFLLQKHI